MAEENEVNKSSGKWDLLIKLYSVIWFFCLLGFGASVLISTNFFKSATGTIFGSSILYIILLVIFGCVGSVTFGLALIALIVKIFSENRVLKFKGFGGAIVSIFKTIFILALFPLYLLYKILDISKFINKVKKEGFKISLFKPSSTKSFLLRFFYFIAILVILIPIWTLGYLVPGIIVAENLGYTTEDINIVGTGSMYPTWPKGTKGKDPKELGKEIVSSAGFLPYPNGLVLGGQRYFDNKISRGDIVTAQNDAIGKLTEKTYGASSGVLKRVIALGGDTIELKDGIVYLNNNPIKEQYIAKPRSTFGEEFLKECQKYTIPNDSAFLMGDNRKGSGDSREFGPVKYSEIKSILPLSKQKGTLDKNWHDATNDLADVAKPKIDINRFVELLNQKRKENSASPIKYEPKLDISAKIRGEYMLTHGSLEEMASYDTIVNAMSKAGYWNNYVWEWRIEGYYEADELIEDYLERYSTDAKNVWFDKKFDDIGIAEVQGTLNGCPTQIIVVHAAGYIPPNYKQSDIDSWKPSFDGLKNIQSGWADLRNNTDFYSQHKADVDRINDIISIRITRIESIVSTMKANKWLSDEQNKWISEDQGLYNEQDALANKLNGK